MKTIIPILAATALALITPHASADEAQVLDTSRESVAKYSTSASMIGTRNTLLFYTFKGQQATLKVIIDNKDTRFPITATVYKFADDATDEGLSKWVNNQHSDGLFIDAAEPIGTYQVPADSLSIVTNKLIDRTKHQNGEHDNYTVKFKIGAFSKEGVFSLKAFTDEAKVHVRAK